MKKILIADDSFFAKKTLKDILNQAGYTDIITSSDGIETIEKYKKEKPDLIFLDIIMDKKNGIEVLKEIRKEDIKTYVVMLTIIAQREILSEVLTLGVSDYIVKPFNEERILSVVKKILG